MKVVMEDGVAVVILEVAMEDVVAMEEVVVIDCG